MRYIWDYVKKYPLLLILDLFGGFFVVLINLGLPTIFAQMINHGIIPENKAALIYWAWVMVLIIVIGLLGRILLSYTSSRLTNNIIRDLRIDLFKKIQQFSHEEYEKIGVSSLVTRITSDAYMLMQFANISLRIGVITPLSFIGSLVMIYITAPSLAWLVAIAIPALILIIYYIAKKSAPLSNQMQQSLDQMNQYSRENLMGMRVIRAFNREEYQEEKFKEETEHFASVSAKLNKLMGLANPLFLHVLIWMIVLIVWFALPNIENQTMQVGNLAAFIDYTFHALFAIQLFSQLFIMYPRTNVSALRIKEVLEMPISIDPNLDGVTETETEGYLEFDNVTFAYPGETENPVLSEISFKAEPGEMIAFIGSTGSGKSTLVQLIPRFFDVTIGKILVDGVDVRDYNLQALRQKIGYIPQKALLFTGTIKENLRYGKHDASLSELEHASDVAQAQQFILKSEQQYQTQLAEAGSNLSGGQKQRLSIARAIVKKPSIYVFDDSFSALDYKTDAELRRRLKEITTEATVLVVAQRVTSIMQADKIIVLNEGKIDGTGTHEELLKTNAIYQEIAASQMKDPFNEEEEHHGTK